MYFSFPNALLPLLIFSIIITIDLGFNCLAAATPALNDGITIHGAFAVFFFGYKNWNIHLFKQYYNTSFLASCVLFLAYLATHFIKPKQKNSSIVRKSVNE